MMATNHHGTCSGRMNTRAMNVPKTKILSATGSRNWPSREPTPKRRARLPSAQSEIEANTNSANAQPKPASESKNNRTRSIGVTTIRAMVNAFGTCFMRVCRRLHQYRQETSPEEEHITELRLTFCPNSGMALFLYLHFCRSTRGSA